MATIQDFARRIRSLQEQGFADPVVLHHLAFDALVLASDAALLDLNFLADLPECDPDTLVGAADDLIQLLETHFGGRQAPLQSQVPPEQAYLQDTHCIHLQLVLLKQHLSRKSTPRTLSTTKHALKLLSLSVRGLQTKYDLKFEAFD